MSATLYHSKGCGSSVPLTALRVLEIPHDLIEFDYEKYRLGEYEGTKAMTKFKRHNPLTQFPTFVTAEGTTITEISAILFYLDAKYASGSRWGTWALNDEQKAGYYRWMCFIPANIYPLVTILDFPDRFVEAPDDAMTEMACKWVSSKVSQRRMEMFKIMEEHLGEGIQRSSEQYALGTDYPTFLDIYLTVVCHYCPYPRWDWLSQNCPQLFSLASKTVKFPGVQECLGENDMPGWTD
ncbi:hypothetical protein C8J56DRAFT_385016 [Mycena floridula]|nr:hypothetical protein C8J56DRAFT_385016 [Mycena floridula]